MLSDLNEEHRENFSTDIQIGFFSDRGDEAMEEPEEFKELSE